MGCSGSAAGETTKKSKGKFNNLSLSKTPSNRLISSAEGKKEPKTKDKHTEEAAPKKDKGDKPKKDKKEKSHKGKKDKKKKKDKKHSGDDSSSGSGSGSGSGSEHSHHSGSHHSHHSDGGGDFVAGVLTGAAIAHVAHEIEEDAQEYAEAQA